MPCKKYGESNGKVLKGFTDLNNYNFKKNQLQS